MNTIDLTMKAMGKARREKEIAEHGKQIFFTQSRVEKSKKTYSRKVKHKNISE